MDARHRKIRVEGRKHTPDVRASIGFLLLYVVLAFWPSPLLAQREAWNWYFPIRRAITFSDGTPKSSYNPNMTNIEGAASLSTEAGALLVYTNGQTVWDADGRIARNGRFLLGGESSTTAALLVKHPNSDRSMLLFTTQDQYSDSAKLCSSRIDVHSGTKRMSVENRNSVLLNSSTEKIAAIDNSYGDGFWLIGIDWTRGRIVSFEITEDGVPSPAVLSDTVYADYEDNLRIDMAGAMKISPGGDVLAIANAGSGSVLMYNYNVGTGSATYWCKLVLEDNEVPYGLEFSVDGRYLYVSNYTRILFDTARIYQFDLLSDIAAEIQRSRFTVAENSLGTIQRFGLMQTGPDGKIYTLLVYDSLVGVIDYPDRAADSCGYRQQVFPVIETPPAYSINGFSLPAFNQSIFYPRRYTHNNVCVGTPSTFRVSDLLACDSIRWLFNDSLAREDSDTGRFVEHLFPSEGRYWVSAVVYRDNAVDTITRRVTIYPTPTVAAMNDTAICNLGSLRLECTTNGREPLVYSWYPEKGLDDPYAAAPLASPDSSTMYHIIVTDLTGCVCEDSVFVEVRQELRMEGPDTVVVCKGEPVTLEFLVGGGMPPYRMTWTASALADTLAASIIVTPGTDATYTCVVTDRTGCQAMDSIRVRVLESPIVELPNEYTICHGSSVRLETMITGGTGTPIVSWKPESGLSDPANPRPIAEPDTSTRYTLLVTDENGCRVSRDVFVRVVSRIEPAITGDSLICEGTSGRLAVVGRFESYAWSTGDTTASIVVDSTGTYLVTVHDGNGCSGEAMIDVRSVPRPSILILGPDSLYPGETIRLETDSGYTSYAWSTGGSGTFIDIFEPGRYLLSVTDRYGCTWTVEKVVFSAAQPMTALFIPDIKAAPGDTVEITVRVTESRNLDKLSHMGFTGVVSFESSVLHPLVNPYRDIGTIRHVELSGEYSTSDEIVLTIPSLVTLGTVSESPITLTDFRWSPSYVSYSSNAGRVKVEICREGGERLFDGTHSLLLAANSPNPFNGSTRIGFTLIERGRTTLHVLDLLGRKVATLVDEFLQPGYHESVFDALSLPSGMYYYVLISPNQSAVRVMTLLK